MIPRATYRLQLHAGFGFDAVTACAPYLAALGVSHAYLSPYLKARPGSTHGYDIVDHGEINPELGDEAAFARMHEALQSRKLGQLLDFVPNHMGVGGSDNPLWLDVLEWGPESRYAGWFDIDWSAHDGGGQDKLLAPVLGEQYGEALRTGKLALKFDDGAFAIWAYDEHKLPICPLTYPLILGHQNAALDVMADRFLDLPQWRPEIAERAHDLKAELAELTGADAKARDEIGARLAAFNRDWRELDALISAQFWRVAFHRVAEDEINYRRFFNINDLAGLRMELAPVFEHAHARVFQMLEAEEIEGLRIDHVDGLFDPKAYLEALRERVGRPFYLVVEKILASHEQLRADWPVEGTTGYDYLNLALGVLVDTSAEAAFTETYGAFAGAGDEFEEIARLCKLRIMDNEMASELNALGRSAARLARQSPMTADLTRAILQRAIKQIVANFPVYRTYVDFAGSPSDADRRDIALRDHEHDPVADARAELIRQRLAEDHPKSPGDQIAQSAREQVRPEVGDAALRIRQNPAHQDAGGIAAVSHHRLLLDIGGGGEHAGKARDLIDLRPPIRDAPLQTGDGGVRREAQNARAQLLFETVHDRQHDDEHRDSQGEPEDRDARDQGHESAPGGGAQIPQA